jgi:hypothetical protein
MGELVAITITDRRETLKGDRTEEMEVKVVISY